MSFILQISITFLFWPILSHGNRAILVVNVRDYTQSGAGRISILIFVWHG